MTGTSRRFIGEYRVKRKLGEGGFGSTYLAHGPAGDLVAIKKIEDSDAGDAIKEANRLCKVSDHPNIVKFRHVIADNCVVMDYVEGHTLKEHLHLNGPFDHAQWWECFRRILEGVAHLHSNELIHRDIKPDNIVLSQNGPILIDFGAARRVGADLTIVGTPAYAPPEWEHGQMGPSSDIYSLAIVAHEMLFGYEQDTDNMCQNLFQTKSKTCGAIADGLKHDSKDRPPTILNWVCRMINPLAYPSTIPEDEKWASTEIDWDSSGNISTEYSSRDSREPDASADGSVGSDTRTVAELRDQIIETFVLPRKSIGFLDDESELVGFGTQVGSICLYWSDGDRDRLQAPRAEPLVNGAYATQKVGNLKKRIEDVYGLPQGCIAVLKPDGSRFRADALVLTVRDAHGE